MKKTRTAKKLALHAETLRRLDPRPVAPADLEAVAGGVTCQCKAPSWPDTCC